MPTPFTHLCFALQEIKNVTDLNAFSCTGTCRPQTHCWNRTACEQCQIVNFRDVISQCTARRSALECGHHRTSPSIWLHGDISNGLIERVWTPREFQTVGAAAQNVFAANDIVAGCCWRRRAEIEIQFDATNKTFRIWHFGTDTRHTDVSDYIFVPSVRYCIFLVNLCGGCALVQLVEYRTRNQVVAGSTHTRSTAINLE